MKTTLANGGRPEWRRWAVLIGVSLTGIRLFAAESAPEATNAPAGTNAPPPAAPPLTPQQMFEGGDKSFDNWIDVTGGGAFVRGNQSAFGQRRQQTAGGLGGIDDLHFQKELNKSTTLFFDGRAMVDERDYRVKLDLEREKLGFLKFSFKEFRTWYDGDGGFYPPTGTWYPQGGSALGLDRGELSFEAGFRKENAPEITFKYTRTFREGNKGSTEWGIAHPAIGVTQGLNPAIYDINEHTDSFQLDATHHIKATDFGAGVRYDTGKVNDALKVYQFPEPRITDRQGTSFDLFSVHAFTETWFKKTLMLSSGYSYSDLDNTFSGSRIYGTDFDVGYVPSAANGFGYYNLSGGSRLHEYVADLNLFYKPAPAWTIVPSVRVQKEDTDADSAGTETLGANAPVPMTSFSTACTLDVRERFDVTYTGLTNWVFYGRGDWTEGSGNLAESGGTGPVAGFGVPPVSRQTDDQRLFQKYSAGVRWYPARWATFDLGGYYKLHHYDYSHNLDSTPNDSSSFNAYPAFLTIQDFDTYDGNIRLTLRPLRNVTLVSRYEYQMSKIHTQPDPASGLDQAETARMNSHILAQDVSWSPWSRLALQAAFNYVLSETKTPATDSVQGILNAQNNYWTANLSSSFVLDDKTDLSASYLYYRAGNYQDNSLVGVPYGAGAEEHAVTASLVRRLTKNIRLSLRYGFFANHDQTYGGNNNYVAHVVYSSLMYRF